MRSSADSRRSAHCCTTTASSPGCGWPAAWSRSNAQPAAGIVRLVRDDLKLTAAGVEIRFADDMVALPVQLRDVAELLLEDSSPNGWLFAGQKAGQPMRPAHLARRLRGLGIPVARARPSAVTALAHRIPAPVLANLLGFGAQTITNASSDLKVDYAPLRRAAHVTPTEV